MAERSQQDVWRLTPWLAIGLLLGNFILMAFDARDSTSGQRMVRVWSQAAAHFVQAPVTTLTASVTGFFQSFANLRSAQSENDQLKQRVQELEVELKQKEDLSTENERLKKMLDFKEESTYKVLTAKVIGRDASVWFDSSIINRGSLDGVELNMPVVADGGIIGRVTAVSPLTAQIDLITKDKSGLGGVVGEIATSNALGVVSGTSKKDLLEMRYVPGSVEVKVGDPVYTSGQDGIFPAGLKIGEIIEVVSGSTTTPHQILIKPGARLDKMQEIAVLIYKAPPRPKYETTVPNAVKDDKK